MGERASVIERVWCPGAGTRRCKKPHVQACRVRKALLQYLFVRDKKKNFFLLSALVSAAHFVPFDQLFNVIFE